MSDSVHLTPNVLRSQANSLRALAKAILADADAAEDVLQDAWLIASKRPVGHASGNDPAHAAGWLRTVVRNLALTRLRGESRRRRRELDSARPEAIGTARGELSSEDRARILRGVTDAVLGLSEPYRTAVLLRYFEGLPPREIAQRQDVPVSTVKSRLTRAFDQLRRSLAREYEGDDAAWRSSLAIFIGASVGAGAPGDKGLSEAVTKAGITVSKAALPLAIWTMKAKLLVAGVTLTALGSVFWDRSTPHGVVPIHTVAPLKDAGNQSGVGMGVSTALANDKPQDSRRTVIDADTPAPTTAVTHATPGSTAAHMMVIEGTFVDEAGLPVASADILAGPRGHVMNYVTTTDELGRFEIRWRALRTSMDMAFAIASDDETFVTLQELHVVSGQTTRLEIQAAPQGETRGGLTALRFEGDSDAAPIRNIIIGRLRLAHDGLTIPRDAPKAIHDAAGNVEFVSRSARSTCPIGASKVVATTSNAAQRLAGYLSDQTAMHIEAGGGLSFMSAGALGHTSLRMNPKSIVIEGNIVDARGEGVASAQVHILGTDGSPVASAQTDADGNYSFVTGIGTGSYQMRAFAPALGLSVRDFRFEAGEHVRWDAQLDPGLELRGHLVGPDGAPLSDWIVDAMYRDAGVNIDRRTRTDSDGYFTITQCAPVETQLAVRSPRSFGEFPCQVITGLWPRAYRPERSEDSFDEIQVESVGHGGLAFSVVDAYGAPVSGAHVRIWRLDSTRGAWATPTDALGETEMKRLPAGSYRLEIGSAAHGWIEVDGILVPGDEVLDLGAIALPASAILALEYTSPADVAGMSLDVSNEESGVRSRVRSLGDLERAGTTGLTSLVVPAGKTTLTTTWKGGRGTTAARLFGGSKHSFHLGPHAPPTSSFAASSDREGSSATTAANRLRYESDPVAAAEAACAACHTEPGER